ncbi:MAG: RluA family pseudouridine synthase [Chloroflexi bacterium]|nr:RluA family pseudouridine synthase [Chloroflexota bacterium]MYD65439.1 RluA family pseudouridine synthase [Chloroflexota bacterium]
MQIERFTADAEDRLDRLVAGHLMYLSRAQVQRLIGAGHADVDGRPQTRPGRRVRAGAEIAIRLPTTPDLDALAAEADLEVLYEDEELLVVNKKAGLLVHPVQGRPAVTLVHVVRAHRPEVASIGGSRSGLVHRLDRDTSGVIAFAKTEAARDSLRAQWKARETLKVYHAIAEGFVEPAAGRIDAPLGPDPADPTRRVVAERGDPAFSEYRVLEQYGDEAALVEVRILTGRTHQIRVHLEAIGHPIIGDAVYGPASPRIERQALHAHRLGLCLPSTGEWREFIAPRPDDVGAAVEALRDAHEVPPAALADPGAEDAA